MPPTASAPERIRVGCSGLPPGMARGRYFAALPYLETDIVARAAVKDGVLRRWRRDTPDRCGFGLVAAVELGDAGFAATTAVAEAWQRTRTAAEILLAEAIVFRPPPRFSPSSAHREALRRFVAAHIDDALRARTSLIWAATGLWEPSASLAVADELGLVAAVDPLATPDAPSSKDAYLHLSGLGLARRSLSDDQLDAVAARAAAAARAWVVIGTPDRFRDARRLQRLLIADPGD